MEKKTRKTAIALCVLALLGCDSPVGSDSSGVYTPDTNYTIYIDNYSHKGAYMTFSTMTGNHILEAKNENEYKIGTNATVKVTIPAYDTVMMYNHVLANYETDSITGEFLNYVTVKHKMVLQDSARYQPRYYFTEYDTMKVYTILPK